MDLDAVSHLRIRNAEPAEIDLLAAIDDDASTLFAQAGIDVDFPPEHVFVAHERSRWGACLAAGTTLLAVDERRGPVGFAMLGRLDGEAYIEQLSVRADATRRGIGTRLLGAMSAVAEARGARAILLTTYGHLAWNRPFYERNGYVALRESDCGREIVRELAMQRAWLPYPEQRLAMRRTLRES